MVQGGDLHHALRGILTAAPLRWYKHGAHVALDIINGLHFLHCHNVSFSCKVMQL